MVEVSKECLRLIHTAEQVRERDSSLPAFECFHNFFMPNVAPSFQASSQDILNFFLADSAYQHILSSPSHVPSSSCLLYLLSCGLLVNNLIGILSPEWVSKSSGL